jgi:hypothetical protein
MNNKRRLSATLLSWVCALLQLSFPVSFPACSKNPGGNNRFGEGAVQGETALHQNKARLAYGEYRLEQALTCRNTSLGISYTVSKGWWLLDLNTANFSSDPDDTVDPAGFDIIHEAACSRMDLINFSNIRYPDRKKYLCFDISLEFHENSPENGESAEQAPAMPALKRPGEDSLSDYAARFLPINQHTDGMTLLDSGQVAINALPFEKQVYAIPHGRNNFRVLYLYTKLKTGYYLIISAVYREAFKDAESYIIELTDKALTLE